MVGRDVLLGAAAASLVMLVRDATFAVSQTPLIGYPAGFGPARFTVYLAAWTLGESMLRGFGLVLLLLVLRAVVRHDVAASLLTTLLVAASVLDQAAGPLGLRAFYAVAAALAAVALARQCGMVAAMSYAFFNLIQQRIPLTLDPDAWYFGRSAVVLLLLALIMAYAFRTSMGTRRWLPRLAFEV